MKFPTEDQIADMAIIGDRLFIVTKESVPPMRNVYCFSTEKEFLWQIQDVRELDQGFDMDDWFVGFAPESYDGLAAHTWGRRFVINPENGKILGYEGVR